MHMLQRRPCASVARCSLATCLLLAATAAAFGQGPTVPPTVWPRVNLSTCYQVDAGFFQRPAGLDWGDMVGIAIDRQGQIWLSTRATQPVQVFDSLGRFVRAWGEGLLGSAHFIRIDLEGMIWLADAKNHFVVRCTPEGKVLMTLGTPGQAGCDATHMNRPTDVATSPAGEIFVSDGYGNARIAHFNKQGKFIKQWGKVGTGPGEFSFPHSILMDSKGLLYVADRSNNRIQVFDQSGAFLAQWRNLLVPWGLYLTRSPQGDDEIWACGSSPMPWRPEDGFLGCPPKDQLVMKFDTSGRVLQLWTFPKGEDGKEKPGELNWLHAIAVDARGNLYVGDVKGKQAQKFVPMK
jgi:DNA-binding beta-propeller fold protein YncE